MVFKDILVETLNKSRNKDHTISLLSSYDQRKASEIKAGNFTSTKCIYFAVRAIYYTFIHVLKHVNIHIYYENLILNAIPICQNNVLDHIQYYKTGFVAKELLPILQLVMEEGKSPDDVFISLVANTAGFPRTPKPSEFKENVIKLVNSQTANQGFMDLFNTYDAPRCLNSINNPNFRKSKFNRNNFQNRNRNFKRTYNNNNNRNKNNFKHNTCKACVGGYCKYHF